jgi:hypothetical protein
MLTKPLSNALFFKLCCMVYSWYFFIAILQRRGCRSRACASLQWSVMKDADWELQVVRLATAQLEGSQIQSFLPFLATHTLQQQTDRTPSYLFYEDGRSILDLLVT